MAELTQTKGTQRFEGIIVGFDPSNENTYREDFTKAGKPYRSVNLSIKTSDSNVIYNIGLFGQSDSNKRVKLFSNKGGEKKSIDVDWDDREDAPDGYTCFGFGTAALAFEYENGKLKRHNYFSYDAVDKIRAQLADGDNVWIDTEFKVERYVSNGEEKTSVKYTLRGIGFLKNPVDFEQENFKEVSSFEQEFVVIDNNIDKDAKKIYVTGRLIEYNKSFNDIAFVVDADKYPTLANNIAKKTRFGDLLHVEGKVVNGAILVEATETENIDWGGETPEGIRKPMVKNKVSEIQITNVKKHTPKVYKESDFVVETFGSDAVIDISDADLPF